jgi:hypothetical protein
MTMHLLLMVLVRASVSGLEGVDCVAALILSPIDNFQAGGWDSRTG